MSTTIFAWPVASGLLLVVCAAAASAGLIALLYPLLRRYALARPNARSSHHVPTPQGGGIAIITTVVAIALLERFRYFGPEASLAEHWVPILAAAFIAVVGAADDIRAIAVGPRLVLQALAVTAVVAALPVELRVVWFLPWWIERALLLVACLWFVNLVNFMDGIDWMTVAEIVPITGGLVVIGALGALPPFGVVVALALCGALIGFAPFNRPVARLFLGDVGSLPIGLLLVWLLVLVAGGGHLAAALILPLYYLADATLTLGRRLAKGERVWQAHRTHFYQRAIDKDFTALEVVTRVFIVNLLLVGLATVTVVVPGTTSTVMSLAGAAALVAWLLMTFARGKH